MSKRKWCPLCGAAFDLELHRSITSASIVAIPELLRACKNLLVANEVDKNLDGELRQLARAVNKAEGKNT